MLPSVVLLGTVVVGDGGSKVGSSVGIGSTVNSSSGMSPSSSEPLETKDATVVVGSAGSRNYCVIWK